MLCYIERSLLLSNEIYICTYTYKSPPGPLVSGWLSARPVERRNAFLVTVFKKTCPGI